MGTKSIPVIDMQDLSTFPEKTVKACEEWGCFRLINHGIPMELMSEMKAVTRSLFDIPMEIRQRNAPIETSNCYIPPRLIPAFHEGLCLSDVTSPGAVDDFCAQLEVSSHQREIISKYVVALHDLAQNLGIKLMEGLGLRGEMFKEWECRMNLNKYSFSPEIEGLSNSVMHTDVGFLTVLQDDELVNGLEVVNKMDGELIPVDPMPGAFVINVGDMAMVWSNRRFHNVKHVVQCFEPAVGKVRISMVLFILAPKNERIEAPPELVDSDHPRFYVPFYFQDYRKIRRESNRALEFFYTK